MDLPIVTDVSECILLLFFFLVIVRSLFKNPICQLSVFHQLEEQKPSQASQSFA